MASWVYRKFSDIDQVTDWLNGVLVGTANLHSNGADVDGKTLILDVGTGPVTVTFAPPKARTWTLEEIIAQINNDAAIPDGTAKAHASLQHRVGARPNRRLRLASSDGCVVHSAGTANTDLGFSAVADTVQYITSRAAVAHIHFDDNKYVVVLYA